MTPGDPFDTKALDAQRSQQRRFLWVLRRYPRFPRDEMETADVGGLDDPRDALMREVACRLEAERLLAPHVAYLETLEAVYLQHEAMVAANAVEPKHRWARAASGRVLDRDRLPEPDEQPDPDVIRDLSDGALFLLIADVYSEMTPD